jgi:predicted DsbA family dithiol-disulfide isomerase
MSEPVVVHLFTDYACPWCYLGRARLKQVAAEQPISIQTVHYQLSADTPAEGRELASYLKSRGYDVREATARLAALMDREGLEWNTAPDRMAYNTLRAQQLAVWAESQGVGEAIHDALFRAYQVDGRNIHDLDVLAEIAASVGLDPDAARAAIVEGKAAQAVARDQATSRQIGVSSVPTYVAGGKGVVGAQSVDVLKQLVRAAASA